MMTPETSSAISDAMSSLADAADTATGDALDKIINVIQQLSDLYGSRVNVRVWLNEFNPDIPVDAKGQEFDEAVSNG